MDFGQAGLLILLTFTGVEMLKRIIPTLSSRLTIPLALAIGVGSAFLVRATVWGNENIVGGHALSGLDTSSTLVVGLLVGAGAVGFHSILGSVRNIGQNQD